MASIAVVGSAHATLDTDLVLITDPGIDFGDNTYLISVSNQYGRMLRSYYVSRKPVPCRNLCRSVIFAW